MNASQGQPALPLFYRHPVPLDIAEHAEWRLAPGDLQFAAETPHVPIVAAEFAAAARDYPVVFAGPAATPVAILGLGRQNLFVEAGRWATDAYVPAYVRRYPFGFIPTNEAGRFALAIDAGSERISHGDGPGEPLFEAEAPSSATHAALAFCDLFHSEAAVTQMFTDALREMALLIDRRADATLPDGRKLGLEGFQIIDRDAFHALADDIVIDWHRKGWLALVDQHLASLGRFTALLARQQAVAPAPNPGTAQ